MNESSMSKTLPLGLDVADPSLHFVCSVASSSQKSETCMHARVGEAIASCQLLGMFPSLQRNNMRVLAFRSNPKRKTQGNSETKGIWLHISTYMAIEELRIPGRV